MALLEIRQRIRVQVPETLAMAENLRSNQFDCVVTGIGDKAVKVKLDNGRDMFLSIALINRREISIRILDASGMQHVVNSVTAKAKSEGRIYVREGDIIVEGTPFAYSDRCRQVVGGRWQKDTDGPKGWYYVANPSNAVALLQAFQGTKTDVSDAALQALAQEGFRVDASSALKFADESELSQPDGLKTRLWLHQKRALAFAASLDGCGLFMDMGTGKTAVTIGYILQCDIQFVLVVAPKSVVKVWPKEWHKHTGDETALVLPLWKGSIASRAERAWDAYLEAKRTGRRLIVVINYDSARRVPFGSTTKASKAVSLKIPWGLFVVDESHKIKSPHGETAKYCHQIAKITPRRLCLTGTPMPHDPGDIWSQFMVIDRGDSFGTAYSRFLREYAIMGGYLGKQILSWRNLPDLEAKMYRRAFRVTEDVVELPPRVFSERYGVLNEDEWKAYFEMQEELETSLNVALIAEEVENWQQLVHGIQDESFVPDDDEEMHEITASNVLSKLLKLAQMSSGFVFDENKRPFEIGHSKIDLLMDTLGEIDHKEPLVIFARFKFDIYRIKAALVQANYTVAELSGARNQLEEWQNGQYQVLVVQLQSGDAGIDLTHCGETPCRYCLYFGKDFNWGNYKQSQKRIHRPGQTETTHFISLIMENTVDQKIDDVLAKRGNLVEAVVNAHSLLHAEEGAVTEQTEEDDEDEELEVAEAS